MQSRRRDCTRNGRSNLGALGKPIDADDEALVDSLVRPGHPSTPSYNDPNYPLTGRLVP